MAIWRMGAMEERTTFDTSGNGEGRNFANRLLTRALTERKRPQTLSNRWFDFAKPDKNVKPEIEEKELAAANRE